MAGAGVKGDGDQSHRQVGTNGDTAVRPRGLRRLDLPRPRHRSPHTFSSPAPPHALGQGRSSTACSPEIRVDDRFPSRWNSTMTSRIVSGLAVTALAVIVWVFPGTAADPPANIPTAPRCCPDFAPTGSCNCRTSGAEAGRQANRSRRLPRQHRHPPDGPVPAVLHAASATRSRRSSTLNPKHAQIVCRVTVDAGASTACASRPDGTQLYASGGEFEVVHVLDFDKGFLSNRRKLDDRVADEQRSRSPAGSALDAGRAGRCSSRRRGAMPWSRVPLDNPDRQRWSSRCGRPPAKKDLPKGDPPSPPDGRKDPNGRTRRRRRTIGGPAAEVRIRTRASSSRAASGCSSACGRRRPSRSSTWRRTRSSATWPTAEHPTEMALSPDGKTLYVACANSTQGERPRHGDGQGAGDDQLRALPGGPAAATRRTACA